MHTTLAFVVVFSLLLYFAPRAHGQVYSFQASVLYNEPGMGNGFLAGQMTYSWSLTNPAPAYKLNFSAQVYSVLYQYNSQRGEIYNVDNPYASQYRYKEGPGCPGGCETGTLNEAMPALFYSASRWVLSTTIANVTGLSNKNCVPYVPTSTYQTSNPPSSVSVLYMVPGTYEVCRANFRDGRTLIMSSYSAAVSGNITATLSPKEGCSCGKPIDVAIVLDRSGSISPSEWTSMKSFLLKFITYFKFGAQQANMGIVHFNTAPWIQLAVADGNSFTNVNNSITAINCCPGAGNGECCSGGTSISSGLQAAAELLSTGRDFSQKVVVLLTDGAHNTFADGKNSSCYRSPCSDEGDLNCIGDRSPQNYIPDIWENATIAVNTNNTQMADCHRDLINAREYIQKKVGESTVIIGVGVGTSARIAELLIVTDNRYKILPTSPALLTTCVGNTFYKWCLAPAANNTARNNSYIPCGGYRGSVNSSCLAADNTFSSAVLNTSGFATLGTILLELSAKVCDSNAQPCGQCCGYCACGSCTKPDSCPNGTNFCQVGTYSGVCCSLTTRVCTPPNPCYTATCDSNANGGAGGCVISPIKCSLSDTPCRKYVCDNSTGSCNEISLVPAPSNSCVTSYCSANETLVVDEPIVCSGPNKCLRYYCDSGSCKSVQNVSCPTPDLCSSGVCNSTTGKCQYTNVTCPANTQCYNWSCNGTSGFCVRTNLVPAAPNACYLSYCDNSTGTETRVFKAVTCTVTNKCLNYFCENATGLCNTTVKTTCPTPDKCSSGACDPSTGVCGYTNVTCAANTACYNYSCNGTTGSCDTKSKVPPAINQCYRYVCDSTTGTDRVLLQSTQCSGSNKCLNYFCENATGLCNTTVKTTCPTPDKCSSGACDPSTGLCVYTNVTCAANTACYNYSCNGTTGFCDTKSKVPAAPNPCVQIFCNTTGVDTIVTTTTTCSGADRCRNYYCNTTTGQCENVVNVTCTPPNGCYTSACDTSTGNCVLTAKTCPASTACYSYTCDNSTGTCKQNDIKPPPANGCYTTYCITNSSGDFLVQDEPIPCQALDPCKVYACQNSTGVCLTSDASPPYAAPNCTYWTCNSSVTVGSPFTLRLTQCSGPDLCNPAVCNNGTNQCVVVPTVCNNVSDKCDLTTCNLNTGACNTRNYKSCSPANLCEENCTCSPANGVCSCAPKKCVPNGCITRSCNLTDGLCYNDFAICPTQCANATCYLKDNQCFSFACNQSTTSSTDKDNCYLVTNLAISKCTAHITDKCLTYNGCDNSTGCTYGSITCGNPANKCNKFIRNSSLTGCCQEVPTNACDTQGPCYTWNCNPTDGGCSYTYNCNLSTPCFNRACLTNGTCTVPVPVDCSTTDQCKTFTSCDDDTAGCQYSAVTCTPSSKCVTVAKNSSYPGCCQESPVNCVLSDKCFLYGCDPANGCTITKKCNSTDACFARSCDPSVGDCLETATDCSTADTCQVQTGCNPSTGCTYKPVVCNTSLLLPCEVFVRDSAYPGCCKKVPKDCTLGDPCTNYTCDTTTGICGSAPLCGVSNACNAVACSNGICSNTPTNCATSDTCLPLTTCDPAKGCIYTAVVCNITKLNPCEEYVRNSSYPGCCQVVPRDCDLGDPCTNYFCNTTLDRCSSSPVCPPSDACKSITCTAGNCNIVNTNCSTADTCLPNTACNPATGCVYTAVSCNESLLAPCEVFVRDSTYPGCCKKVPKDCDGGDPCRVYSCNTATNACQSVPRCNASTACDAFACVLGVCQHSTTDCTSGDRCNPSIGCDPVNGCIFEKINCTDADPCTIDSCINGTCSNVPILCNDSNPCTVDRCVGGKCTFTPLTCDDSDACTDDSCDITLAEGNACVFTPVNTTQECNDNNLCTRDYCNTTHRCINEDISASCVAAPCRNAGCDIGRGCVEFPVVCVLNASDPSQSYDEKFGPQNNQSVSSCNIPSCIVRDLANGTSFGKCDVLLQSCTIGITEIAIISGVSAGAIAGIVIAIVICIGFGSSGAVAAYNKWVVEDEGGINSNPLYEEQARGGANPVWEATRDD